jgi:phosphoglucomutase
VVDLDIVRGAQLTLAVDPLGGAAVHYWSMIGDRYRLPMTVVSDVVDSTFAFMTLD